MAHLEKEHQHVFPCSVDFHTSCFNRCASPLLTITAALAHGRPLWLSPAPEKRAEVNAARQALAPQVSVEIN
jgi:hypothetical protein